MLRVSNIKLPLEARGEVLPLVIRKLQVPRSNIKQVHIYKESIDARKKGDIRFVYTVDVEVDGEDSCLKRLHDADIIKTPELDYQHATPGSAVLKNRPVVIGMGPAGLFAALLLAEMGYRPLVLERGRDVDARTNDVETFWAKGNLNLQSNVQFGEGGAGTFSDGKLTTLIRDRRCRKVLQDMVKAGAPKDILYSHKPHVGTDILRSVVKSLRQRIIACGGEVVFEAHVSDFLVVKGKLQGVRVNGLEQGAEAAILALGHSARDTYATLHSRGFSLSAKPFSVGARLEHPQSLIDRAQYGSLAGHPNLGAADYKLSYHGASGRSAYTFCMCPGGIVVAAASEEGRVVTNGMSYHARKGENANSALLVGVEPSDYGSDHPLAGVEFQRDIEEKAYSLGGGGYKAPSQLVGDFLLGRPSVEPGEILPSYQPGVTFTSLASCLPPFVISTMQDAIRSLDIKIPGFARADAVLTGVETRSSAPVRILRDEGYMSSISGLYPAGEGAGYAGGIVSAAVDGMKVAEQIIQKFSPLN